MPITFPEPSWDAPWQCLSTLPIDLDDLETDGTPLWGPCTQTAFVYDLPDGLEPDEFDNPKPYCLLLWQYVAGLGLTRTRWRPLLPMPMPEVKP